MVKERPGFSPERRARVLIIDDHPIVRHGLAELINHEKDLKVCAQADRPFRALKAVDASLPDLVIADLSLGDESGLELVKELKARHPELPILVLSMHDESYFADRVIRAGAMGYIMKEAPPEQVIHAIRQVLVGKVYLSEAMAASMLDQLVGRKGGTQRALFQRLSDRELEVLRLVGKGLGTRQIAEKLYISVKTVENHREHIKTKLNLRSAPELLRYAVRFEMEAGS